MNGCGSGWRHLATSSHVSPSSLDGSVEVVVSGVSRKPASVLIVEDDALVGSYIETVLSESGFEIVGVAASAPEAQSLADEHHPTLALVDIRLTGPIDGIELACLLREKFGVPAIFLTGFDDLDTEARAQAARPLGYLAKPVRPSQIYTALEQALEQLKP
ncbi:MAG: response regulator [Alphaproteobacteria bacterium]|nr:response regulator [Alphaproteobacteria bacterium]